MSPGGWQEPAGYEKRPVTVLGGGVLGRRIAACWCAGGWPVKIRDPSQEQRDAAVDYVKSNITTYTYITGRKASTVEALEDFQAAVRDAWLVIEAVPEKLELKLSTFADLEQYAPKDCILATNSSSYKAGDLIERISDEAKTRVLNTHYMMPPDTLVVEFMTDGFTHPEIFPFMRKRQQEAGTHPIVALRPSTGFVFNRIWAAIKRETLKVLTEGVSTPAEIDAVFREMYTSRVGPCQMMDQVGLDTVEHIEEHYISERHMGREHLDWLHQNYVAQGKLGKKGTRGGLYPPPARGAQTKLLILNIGLAEPLSEGLPDEQLMHRGQMLSLNVSEGAKPVQILGGLFMPDGIDIDNASKRVFWTTMGIPKKNDGAVYSANLDGSDIQTIVAPGDVHTPKECVVDPDGKWLYFSDREGLRVMRVRLDGTGLETLVQTGDWTHEKDMMDQTKWPVGIAVSHQLGKIFWTQKGYSKSNTGRIMSASIDMPTGTSAVNRGDIETVLHGLPEPIDLELDDEEGIMYWTDRGELPLGNTLNRKHLVGDTPAAEKKRGYQVLAQGFGEAIGVRLDRQNKALWVADMVGRVFRCDLANPASKVKVWEADTSCFTGLALLRE